MRPCCSWSSASPMHKRTRGPAFLSFRRTVVKSFASGLWCHGERSGAIQLLFGSCRFSRPHKAACPASVLKSKPVLRPAGWPTIGPTAARLAERTAEPLKPSNKPKAPFVAISQRQWTRCTAAGAADEPEAPGDASAPVGSSSVSNDELDGPASEGELDKPDDELSEPATSIFSAVTTLRGAPSLVRGLVFSRGTSGAPPPTPPSGVGLFFGAPWKQPRAPLGGRAPFFQRGWSSICPLFVGQHPTRHGPFWFYPPPLLSPLSHRQPSPLGLNAARTCHVPVCLDLGVLCFVTEAIKNGRPWGDRSL